MTRCANTQCKWHDKNAQTACTLFHGKSWLECRTKIIRPTNDQPKQEKQQ